MERPKIEDYWGDITLSEIEEFINDSPELLEYVQALNKYTTALEESLENLTTNIEYILIDYEDWRSENNTNGEEPEEIVDWYIQHSGNLSQNKSHGKKS